MPSITDCKCVLVIGATAGIGRALALVIHELPSKPTVIVAGRRQERLDELTEEGDRIKAVNFDVNSGRDALKSSVQDIVTNYPDLDAVMFSSGIQHIFDFKKPESVDLDKLETELNTNYTSIIRMTTFFLPHFLKLSERGRPSFIITVTSGLAIVPGPWVPNYCATKAALHSFSLSLDQQLKDTNVTVMEIIPPLVESELHDHQGTTPKYSKFWMPLDEFTKGAMEGLKRGDLQIPVGTAAQQWEVFEKGKAEKAAKTQEIFQKNA
ncbi:NAD(P)-binding protein [Laetiporus sulphureus 93-53]|uniref:NAD(P)-binding protein n=1 Tax=Laetiporus sulphureus 93-53 TaxID=1314785 RepID=A0A165DZ01_9APHY|nr:NAD(P)-binding protein [Laetiporus sulphureus 93-53]KZT05921.1 NAD(P)-binding protein [Laetiporus sulphureus 93-53]